MVFQYSPPQLSTPRAGSLCIAGELSPDGDAGSSSPAALCAGGSFTLAVSSEQSFPGAPFRTKRPLGLRFQRKRSASPMLPRLLPQLRE